MKAINTFIILKAADTLMYLTCAVLSPLFIYQLGKHLKTHCEDNGMIEVKGPQNIFIILVLSGINLVSMALTIKEDLKPDTPWLQRCLFLVFDIYIFYKPFIISYVILFGCSTSQQFSKERIL